LRQICLNGTARARIGRTSRPGLIDLNLPSRPLLAGCCDYCATDFPLFHSPTPVFGRWMCCLRAAGQINQLKRALEKRLRTVVFCPRALSERGIVPRPHPHRFRDCFSGANLQYPESQSELGDDGPSFSSIMPKNVSLHEGNCKHTKEAHAAGKVGYSCSSGQSPCQAKRDSPRGCLKIAGGQRQRFIVQ